MKDAVESLPIAPPPKPESFRQKIQRELQDPTLKSLNEKNKEKRPLWSRFFGRRNRNNIDSSLDSEDKQAVYLVNLKAKVGLETAAQVQKSAVVKKELRSEEAERQQNLAAIKAREERIVSDDEDERTARQAMTDNFKAEQEAQAEELALTKEMKEAGKKTEVFPIEETPTNKEQQERRAAFEKQLRALFGTFFDQEIRKKQNDDEKKAFIKEQSAIWDKAAEPQSLQEVFKLLPQEKLSSFVSRRITESLQLESEWQALPNQENPGKIALEIARAQLAELKTRNNYQEEEKVPQAPEVAVSKESLAEMLSALKDPGAREPLTLHTLEQVLTLMDIPKITSIKPLSKGGFFYPYVISYRDKVTQQEKRIVVKVSSAEKPRFPKNVNDDDQRLPLEKMSSQLTDALSLSDVTDFVPLTGKRNVRISAADVFSETDFKKMSPKGPLSSAFYDSHVMDYVPKPITEASSAAKEVFLSRLCLALKSGILFDLHQIEDFSKHFALLDSFRYDPKKDAIMLVDTGYVNLGGNKLNKLLTSPMEAIMGGDPWATLESRLIVSLAQELGYTSVAEFTNKMGITTDATAEWSFAEYQQILDSIDKFNDFYSTLKVTDLLEVVDHVQGQEKTLITIMGQILRSNSDGPRWKDKQELTVQIWLDSISELRRDLETAEGVLSAKNADLDILSAQANQRSNERTLLQEKITGVQQEVQQSNQVAIERRRVLGEHQARIRKLLRDIDFEKLTITKVEGLEEDSIADAADAERKLKALEKKAGLEGELETANLQLESLRKAAEEAEAEYERVNDLEAQRVQDGNLMDLDGVIERDKKAIELLTAEIEQKQKNVTQKKQQISEIEAKAPEMWQTLRKHLLTQFKENDALNDVISNTHLSVIVNGLKKRELLPAEINSKLSNSSFDTNRFDPFN